MSETFMAWSASTTLDYGGICGPLHFQSVDVPLDEAASLSDRLFGGPYVQIAPGVPYVSWITREELSVSWDLRLTAFIAEEAYEALYAVADILTGPRLLDIKAPAAFRLRDIDGLVAA